MAKAGFWLRGAKGKLAGTVLQKGENGTIQRENVKPKNPQSNSQMAHRIIFATVTQAAKFMFPLIKQSFEGFPEGQLSRREFVRINTKHLRALAAEDYENQTAGAESNTFVTTKGVSALIPNRYIISNGSIEYTGNAKAFINEDNQVAFGITDELPLPCTVIDTQVKINAGALIKTLLGIESVNDQITIVNIVKANNNVIFDYDNGAVGAIIGENKFIADRLVLATSNFQDIVLGTYDSESGQVDLDSNFRSTMGAYFNTEKSSSKAIDWFLAIADNIKYIVEDEENLRLEIDSPQGIYMYEDKLSSAIIKSSLVNGEWKRSKAVMLSAPPTESVNYGLYYNAGIAAWFTGGSEITDNGKFLNEGGQANSI